MWREGGKFWGWRKESINQNDAVFSCRVALFVVFCGCTWPMFRGVVGRWRSFSIDHSRGVNPIQSRGLHMPPPTAPHTPLHGHHTHPCPHRLLLTLSVSCRHRPQLPAPQGQPRAPSLLQLERGGPSKPSVCLLLTPEPSAYTMLRWIKPKDIVDMPTLKNHTATVVGNRVRVWFLLCKGEGRLQGGNVAAAATSTHPLTHPPTPPTPTSDLCVWWLRRAAQPLHAARV